MSAHAETRPTNEFTPECLAPPHEQVSAEASEPETAELPEDEMDDSDEDSAVGTYHDFLSLATSLIYDYRRIHRRDYPSDECDAIYWLPIDDSQLEAQEIAHKAVTLLLGEELHLATLNKNTERVLDIGTGEGSWAIEFADEHRNIGVFGTDISPIQPTCVPPNIEFLVEDCTKDWIPWNHRGFDYVHIRGLTGNIKDWSRLFSQVYHHTYSGGLVESHEASFRIRSDYGNIEPKSALAEMGDIFEKAGKETGCKFDIADNNTQRKSMEEAGFVIIRDQKLIMPIGEWSDDPKLNKTGKKALEAFTHDLGGYMLYVMTQVLKWDYDAAQMFLVGVRKELRQDRMRLYVEHHVVVGQKPESECGPGV